MNVCDLCGRKIKGDFCAADIYLDDDDLWSGHLCGDCRKRVADSLRTLIPSPAPDAATFVTPVPKQAYVWSRRPGD